MGLKPVTRDSVVDIHWRSNETMLISKLHNIPIPMTCDNACAIEKHNNESIASQGGAIEKYLMDSSHFT